MKSFVGLIAGALLSFSAVSNADVYVGSDGSFFRAEVNVEAPESGDLDLYVLTVVPNSVHVYAYDHGNGNSFNCYLTSGSDGYAEAREAFLDVKDGSRIRVGRDENSLCSAPVYQFSNDFFE